MARKSSGCRVGFEPGFDGGDEGFHVGEEGFEVGGTWGSVHFIVRVGSGLESCFEVAANFGGKDAGSDKVLIEPTN